MWRILPLLCHSLLFSLSSSLFFNKAVCLSALLRHGPPAMWKVNPCVSASRLHLPGNPLAQADSRTTLTSRAWPATWGWASLNHFSSIPPFRQLLMGQPDRQWDFGFTSSSANQVERWQWRKIDLLMRPLHPSFHPILIFPETPLCSGDFRTHVSDKRE